MTKQYVNITEYGKMRGVSRQAVHEAIRDGRIAEAVGENKKIDVELADKLWAANTHPDKGFHGQMRQRAKRQTIKPDDEAQQKVAAKLGLDPDDLPTLVESKTLQAAYQAQLAKLDYEERSAKLIDMEKVRQQAFKAARLTRDAMLAIPDRVSAEIAGMTDPFEIHRKLSAEIRAAISEIIKEVGDE